MNFNDLSGHMLHFMKSMQFHNVDIIESLIITRFKQKYYIFHEIFFISKENHIKICL